MTKSGVVQMLRDASKRQRFYNLLIDNLGVTVLIAVVFVLLPPVGRAELLEGFGGSVFGYAIVLAYYVGFEATLGRTPGKLVTGTKVIGVDGGRPSLAQILGRTFTRLIPFEPLSFLGRGRGWHDRWSRTRVVCTELEVEVEVESVRPARRVTSPRIAARRVRVVVDPDGERDDAQAGSYRAVDPSKRRVVCGVCNEEFKYGRSSCPGCDAQYRYVRGRPELCDE